MQRKVLKLEDAFEPASSSEDDEQEADESSEEAEDAEAFPPFEDGVYVATMPLMMDESSYMTHDMGYVQAQPYSGYPQYPSYGWI